MALAPDIRLGPYDILGLLGAGGMGEVYRARDPRLGRDVAIKILPEDVARDRERLSRFEREARAVAALNHPNILTVFDVGSHADATAAIPYVVTELLEGETLRELVSRRAPTQRQILSFAVQVAHGLDAAHTKGIVHRDLKPENVFVTTDGRVKLLDFGLAKQVDRLAADSVEPTASSPTGAGQMVGTVGYMSPEQVRGLPVDPRTDVFSLGVLLYELLAGKHPFRRETTVATLTAILEETPAELVGLGRGIPPALGGIVRRCLEKPREERYPSAHDVAVALETVLAAPAGAAVLQEVEERSPYPGLMSFTERDTAVFFGREAEVKALWQRLQSRRLLAVIGPSGAGKTSFVRAGVIPARPEGWAVVCGTPGARPFLGLAQALTPELAGDTEAMADLLRGVTEIIESGESERVVSAVRRWRQGHGEALLVVDQFEELFTLSAKETQERFAALLGRLTSEADVHVLLSLRDDFLIRCSEHEPLAPVFESLTPLPGLSADGLRRALVEPARKLGYRFEDEALVAEMIEAVEGARGALPLLAFAVARLWEKRDRERKLLTRAGYEEIGGVAGALAQHAEATLDRIGTERQGIVREVFRNLATAQGTRAVVDHEELLSAFPQREGAQGVLRALIDARLLTSYEVQDEDGKPSHHRIEVVHESLLKAWPRLVRWQAQDEEGAVLRDQLRQAAHLWEEKKRTSDLLWTGMAYREYELWRERYAGALTALEEDFARAMADKARRRRRLLTAAVSSVIVALAGVAIAIGVSRQQTARARDRANAEALRAEAGKLLALGRVELDPYPTAALAYARASLELADTPEARRFAVEVLWRGPVARILPVRDLARKAGIPDADSTSFGPATLISPDGSWLATGSRDGRILLFPWDGGPLRHLPPPPGWTGTLLEFGPHGDLLVTGGSGDSLRFLSLPDLRETRRVELGGLRSWGKVRRGSLFTFTLLREAPREYLVRAWPLPDGEPKVLGTLDLEGWWDVDPGGTILAFNRGRTVLVRPLDPARGVAERVLGNLGDEIARLFFDPLGEGVVSTDKSGESRLWPLAAGSAAHVLTKAAATAASKPILDTQLRRSFVVLGSWFNMRDLGDPPEAEPIDLKQPGEVGDCLIFAFHSDARWLTANNCLDVAFWPLGDTWMRTLHGIPRTFSSTNRMSFSPDSHWLATCTLAQPVRLWPLHPSDGTMHPLLPAQPCGGISIHPAGTHVLVGTWHGGSRVYLYPMRGDSSRPLPTAWEGASAVWGTVATAFDASGRWAAAAPRALGVGLNDPKLRVLRVWDLESGRPRDFSLAHLITETPWFGFSRMRFAPDGSLYAAGQDAVRRFVLPSQENGALSMTTLYTAGVTNFDLSRDGRRLLVWSFSDRASAHPKEMVVFDLAAGTSRRITTHGQVFAAALDASGRIVVSGDMTGVVRVGPITGEEPHLLLGGHADIITALAISPDGRWIASVSDDAFHLWPMPDVTKPPFHTLPHNELMAKLQALTNLRVVRDESSSTGWKLDVGPFPGWKDVPTW